MRGRSCSPGATAGSASSGEEGLGCESRADELGLEWRAGSTGLLLPHLGGSPINWGGWGRCARGGAAGCDRSGGSDGADRPEELPRVSVKKRYGDLEYILWAHI